MRQRASTLLLVVAFAGTASAAGTLTARAVVNRTQVRLDEPLQLRVEVNGTQRAAAPTVTADGFAVRYLGPSTEITVVNGQMSASVTHTYLLMPQKAGRWTIGPIAVEADGTTLRTEPVTVEVLPQGAPRGAPEEGSAPPEGTLQLQVGVARTTAYVGEHLPMRIQLLVGGVAVRGVQPPTLQADGFQVGPFSPPAQSDVTVEGQPPMTLLEFPTTLVPLQPGRLQVGPAALVCQVVRRQSIEPFDALFEQAYLVPVVVRAEPVTIEVRPLPETGRPATFRGAVGRFTFSGEAGPSVVAVGEAATIVFHIRGEGIDDTLAPPVLNVDATQWRLLETRRRPTAVAEEVVFEQDVMPLTTSVTAIPAAQFSFFNPSTGAYETLTAGPWPLTVHPVPVGSAISAPKAAGRRPAAPLPMRRVWRVRWSPSGLGVVPWPAAIASTVVLLAVAGWVRRHPSPRDCCRRARQLAQQGRLPDAYDQLIEALERHVLARGRLERAAPDAAELLQRCAAARSAPASTAVQQFAAIADAVEALLRHAATRTG